VKELVITSGKGGTGKTSVAASFAALARGAVIADCDVDAADLHLVLSPEVRRREEFSGGEIASVRADSCTGCGRCVEVCRFDAVSLERQATDVDGEPDADGASAGSRAPGGAGSSGRATISPLACEGCGVCAHVCPEGAIDLRVAVNGEWFVSDTRCGALVHARLGIAQGNSGKLVTLVRKEARRIAEARGADFILVDGAPGIGCPVIASLTGADLALAVTEPTLSGLHDLRRVVEVARRLRVPAAVCVSKWDLSLESAHAIEEWCHEEGVPVVGLIPYDGAVTAAQIAGLSVVEYSDGGAASAVRDLWTRVSGMLES